MKTLSEQQKKSNELEKRIFDYKLKELQSWRSNAFILEVNGKQICVNRNNNMILTNHPFPSEFLSHDVKRIEKIITGESVQAIPVKEWYKAQLKRLTLVLMLGKEVVNG